MSNNNQAAELIAVSASVAAGVTLVATAIASAPVSGPIAAIGGLVGGVGVMLPFTSDRNADITNTPEELEELKGYLTWYERTVLKARARLWSARAESWSADDSKNHELIESAASHLKEMEDGLTRCKAAINLVSERLERQAA